MPTMVRVRKSFSMHVDVPLRKRDRPKRTWMEVVMIDLKKCNLYEDLAQDRMERRDKTHVADPNMVCTRL